MKRISRKYLTIGMFLKEKREDAGLSQGDVRDALGYKTPQIISDWERGVCGAPRDALLKLADLYKVKPAVLADVLLEAERKEIATLLRLKRKA